MRQKRYQIIEDLQPRHSYIVLVTDGNDHRSLATNPGESSIKGEGEGIMIEVPQPNLSQQKDD